MKPVGPSLARPVALSVLSCAALLALPGCGDKKEASKGNFQSAIQAYMDTTPGACVALPAKEAPFSLEKDGGFFRDRLAKAAALVEAGLLSARDTEITVPGSARKVAGTEYSLTEEGKKFLAKEGGGNIGRFDAFCAGKYKVTEVLNFTDPAETFGMKISQANYRYSVDGAPKWAALPSIRAAFPEFAKDFQSEAANKAVLVSTSDGWMHERLFKAKGG